ncbi:EF-hand domain-containing protein [Sagittula salina]|nr:EF-hand domain-containing protein [Sagittula salina]
MTKTTTTLWITGALIAALGAGAAQAHDNGRESGSRDGMGPRGAMGGAALEQMITDADADGDGKVTKAEMEAAASKRFSDADTDGDGKLSAEELTAQAEAMRVARQETRRAKRTEAMIRRFDYDGDGALSQQEMQAMRPADLFDRMLERLDTDKDGALSTGEVQAAGERMQDRRAQRGERFGRHEGRGERGENGHRWFPRGQAQGDGLRNAPVSPEMEPGTGGN